MKIPSCTIKVSPATIFFRWGWIFFLLRILIHFLRVRDMWSCEKMFVRSIHTYVRSFYLDNITDLRTSPPSSLTPFAQNNYQQCFSVFKALWFWVRSWKVGINSWSYSERGRSSLVWCAVEVLWKFPSRHPTFYKISSAVRIACPSRSNTSPG